MAAAVFLLRVCLVVLLYCVKLVYVFNVLKEAEDTFPLRWTIKSSQFISMLTVKCHVYGYNVEFVCYFFSQGLCLRLEILMRSMSADLLRAVN